MVAPECSEVAQLVTTSRSVNDKGGYGGCVFLRLAIADHRALFSFFLGKITNRWRSAYPGLPLLHSNLNKLGKSRSCQQPSRAHNTPGPLNERNSPLWVVIVLPPNRSHYEKTIDLCGISALSISFCRDHKYGETTQKSTHHCSDELSKSQKKTKKPCACVPTVQFKYTP
ncbi:hypothetical protein BDZ94DRAFT_1275594 [Collybia nuda]|uniref:Uncharacterized protein n=1 Tax=Collybia nuda TaxID=64659 RepID=A0A9P6CBV2_9AGAR|nr:hypothetical protein BDZ94DRAFT_1275594 [Collybia nuda]